MNAYCPHCKQKYKVESEMLGKVAQCSSCGKDFTIKVASPPLPTPAQLPTPPKAQQVMPSQSAPENAPDGPAKPVSLAPAGLVLAAILCGLWAVLIAGIALRFLLVDAAEEISWWSMEETGAILTAVWNMMIAGVYVLFACRIPKRDNTWGYSWPLGSNILNAVFSVVNILRCMKWENGPDLRVEAFGSMTLPIEIAIVVLLLCNKKHFSQGDGQHSVAGGGKQK